MSITVGIGMLGCGTVGSTVARILTEHQTDLERRTGLRLELRRVLVRDPRKRRSIVLPAELLSTDASSLLEDPRIGIVVELIGGVDQAKALTHSAIAAGKDVVTANKALLALHGPEVFGAARQAGRCIAFEAAVAGGVPLVEAVRRGLIANRIDALVGILNGTCNFILSRMLDNNASYAHALAEAKKLGYAEADPTLDVSGADSAHKLVILASLAMRRACSLDGVSIAGITDIELIDLSAGRELGFACKLLAIARGHGDALELRVQPTFVPLAHPLAAVSGPFNAVSVYGDAVGHTLFYGRGAGAYPTASAVVSDLIEVAVGNAARAFAMPRVLPDQTPPASYRDPGQSASPHYLRVGLPDRPGCIGKIATCLGEAGVSIAAIVQHEPPSRRADGAVPVVVTTHPVSQAQMLKAISMMTGLNILVGRPVCIPVLDVDEAAHGEEGSDSE